MRALALIALGFSVFAAFAVAEQFVLSHKDADKEEDNEEEEREEEINEAFVKAIAEGNEEEYRRLARLIILRDNS